MKTHTPLKRSTKSILACAAVGIGLHAGKAPAQTLELISSTVNDGGFESVTVKTPFTTTASATTGVPYWGATGPIVDSGSEPNANDVQAGTSGSYYRAADSPAFNLASTYSIKAGDQFILTWFAQSSGATLSTQTVTLFSQAAPAAGASYTYNGTTLATADGTTGTTYALSQAGFTQYTLTYTAGAADVGKSIGLTFANSNSPTDPANFNNTFVTADTFDLSVVSVPEPRTSTYAVVCAGFGGLALLRRRLVAGR